MPGKTEYNEDIYKISDNIETSGDKRIAVFSSSPEIARDLSRLNKAMVIKHNMLDMMPALVNEHGGIEIVASFSLTGDDNAAIYCNDKLLSDFMSAFMRMHELRACCNPLDSPFLKEDSGKKLIHIDIPGSYKNKLTMLINGMESFLNGDFYLFNKKLYASKEEWERNITLALQSILSNVKGLFMTITPESINYAVDSTLTKVDHRHKKLALSVANKVVGSIKNKIEAEKINVRRETTKEQKRLKAEKTSVQRQMLVTDKAMNERQKEMESIANSKAELERKLQGLEAGKLQVNTQKCELEKTLAEFKELKAKYREEQKELEKSMDIVKAEKHEAGTEVHRLEGLKEELDKGKKEILEKRAEAEKVAKRLQEEKGFIDDERLRLEEMLAKLEKEKAEADAKKAELESSRIEMYNKKHELEKSLAGLREKVKLKRKMKTMFAKKLHLKKRHKAKVKILKTKPVLKPVKKKKTWKHYKQPSVLKPKRVEGILAPSYKPKTIPAESILHTTQRIGYHRLKSKWHEPVHKRKRLGAWILEKKKVS